MIRNTSQSIFT